MGKWLIFTLLFSLATKAQRIDNSHSFREIKSDNSIRISYDNDYFGSNDHYYSQGFAFELINPLFKGNFINYILPKPGQSVKKYGLSFEHNLFTPYDISADSLLVRDRPYAGIVMLDFFVTSTDTVRKNRLTSSLTVGFIGPMAFGEEMQRTYHVLSGNANPGGWKHQIRNEFLINYGMHYESRLFALDYFSMQSHGHLQLGTMRTALSGGLSATAGITGDPFSSKPDKALLAYLYAHASVSVVGYDATLQGGLFNRGNPHVIAAKDVNRLTFGQDFGVVVQWKNIYLEGFVASLTKEFSYGKPHRWGGIRIGYKL